MVWLLRIIGIDSYILIFIDEDVEREYLIKKWNDIMDKMIYSFGQIVEDKLFDITDQKQLDEIQEGIDLFAKHYTSLWD